VLQSDTQYTRTLHRSITLHDVIGS